jgi:hypothetical protein
MKLQNNDSHDAKSEKPNAYSILMSQTKRKRVEMDTTSQNYATRCPYCTKLLRDEDFDFHLQFCASKHDTQSNSDENAPTQSTSFNLNSFLGLKPENLLLPTHFHLHVTRPTSPDKRPILLSSFLFEPPKEVRYTQTVNWRAERRDLILTCNVPFSKPIIEAFANNTSIIPLLKSHLQKSIRRGLPLQAVKTSASMMKRDPVSLIRRLGIIACEDVVLNQKEFVTLTWFLLAVTRVDTGQPSPGSTWMHSWIHAYCESLANCPVYESETNFDTPSNPSFKLSTVRNVDSQLRNMVYALMIRKSFGGSGGDVHLLHNTAVLWIQRHEQGIPLQHASLVPVLPYSQKQLEALAMTKDMTLDPASWELSAVDFHVHRAIIDRMRDKFLDEDWEQIGGEDGFKQAMWQFGSGLTGKNPWPFSDVISEDWQFEQDGLIVIPCKESNIEKQGLWKKYAKERELIQYLSLKSRLLGNPVKTSQTN